MMRTKTTHNHANGEVSGHFAHAVWGFTDDGIEWFRTRKAGTVETQSVLMIVTSSRRNCIICRFSLMKRSCEVSVGFPRTHPLRSEQIVWGPREEPSFFLPPISFLHLVGFLFFSCAWHAFRIRWVNLFSELNSDHETQNKNLYMNSEHEEDGSEISQPSRSLGNDVDSG